MKRGKNCKRFMSGVCKVCDKKFKYLGRSGSHQRLTCGDECERKSKIQSQFAERDWPDTKEVWEQAERLRADRSQRKTKVKTIKRHVNYYAYLHAWAIKFAGTK